MIDISTTYLGLPLKSPLVASAGPLCKSLENIRHLEDAGAAAVVLPSLFEEQLDLESNAVDSDLSRGNETFAESLNYLPDLLTYNLGTDGYLELIRKARERVSIPVIASLNGVSPGGWARYAAMMEQAGADAIELNIYAIITDPNIGSVDVEQNHCDLIRQVKANVSIPIAVKFSHFFTAVANLGMQFDAAGAAGLVLFNRFYQPDFDIESLTVVPRLTLSRPEELLLRLHWVGILYGWVRANLAITGGVHSAGDVLKSMMAGAHVAMMTSALLIHGIDHIGTVLAAMRQWMEEHEYESVQQMRGSMSQRAVSDPAAFDRGNYMRVLGSYAG
jgi:dihydroorotate dehydrogenase (fumarate)